jgi:hypothetical protein
MPVIIGERKSSPVPRTHPRYVLQSALLLSAYTGDGHAGQEDAIKNFPYLPRLGDGTLKELILKLPTGAT